MDDGDDNYYLNFLLNNIKIYLDNINKGEFFKVRIISLIYISKEIIITA